MFLQLSTRGFWSLKPIGMRFPFCKEKVLAGVVWQIRDTRINVLHRDSCSPGGYGFIETEAVHERQVLPVLLSLWCANLMPGYSHHTGR